VTAILKVTHINHLLNAPYGPDLIRSGQKALEPVLNMFIKKTVEQTRPATPVSALFKPEKNSFGNFWGSQQAAATQASQIVVAEVRRGQDTEKELSRFNNLILDTDLMSKVKNSVEFWKKYYSEMPLLSELFTILDNIPAASAQIERFFSMTGLVCDKRRLRMTKELIIMRSMLLANMSILQNINTLGE